jgi:hypothetical protein
MQLENKESEVPFSDVYGQTDVHKAQSFMNSERALTPKMVSSLLNVNVLLQSEHIHTTEKTGESFSFLYGLLVLVIAVALAVTLGTSLLYVNEIGPFYADAEEIDFK